MARTKERRGVREPRLFWHELPLGHLHVGDEVTLHQIREDLLPLLRYAIFTCFHDPSVVRWVQERHSEWDGYISCDRFYLGATETWVSDRWTNWGDRNSVTVRYQLKLTEWMHRVDPRRLQRLERPRVITGWLAQGTTGGVSLYVRRHRRWKRGRYRVER